MLTLITKQFEPETFVDGLLGIGSAGGKSGKSDEGKALEGRLQEMRKARDDRAKEIKKAAKEVPVGSGMMDNGSDDMRLDTSSMENAAASPASNNNLPPRPKNKKKKKKKKKAKR